MNNLKVSNNILDCIIIGAGPAGVTAAIYLARKGLKFMVISPDIGGQVAKTSVVENYIGFQEITGAELTKKFEEHLKTFKFEHHPEEAKRIRRDKDNFEVVTASGKFQSKSIIIASGAKPRLLNIPGEKEFKNKGVTYCTTCDGPLYKNKVVAVIGGGNVAFESVLQLINIAKKVFVIDIDKFDADKILIDKAKVSPKVEFKENTKIAKILGDQVVEKIIVDQQGKEQEIAVQGVFIDIGYIPNSALLNDLAELNKRDEIKVESDQQTTMPGIFAAGDCTSTPYQQILIASGEGATAALSVFKYLAFKK